QNITGYQSSLTLLQDTPSTSGGFNVPNITIINATLKEFGDTFLIILNNTVYLNLIQVQVINYILSYFPLIAMGDIGSYAGVCYWENVTIFNASVIFANLIEATNIDFTMISGNISYSSPLHFISSNINITNSIFSQNINLVNGGGLLLTSSSISLQNNI